MILVFLVYTQLQQVMWLSLSDNLLSVIHGLLVYENFCQQKTVNIVINLFKKFENTAGKNDVQIRRIMQNFKIFKNLLLNFARQSNIAISRSCPRIGKLQNKRKLWTLSLGAEKDYFCLWKSWKCLLPNCTSPA